MLLQFAFGMVLVELLTGRNPLESAQLYTMEEDFFPQIEKVRVILRLAPVGSS